MASGRASRPDVVTYGDHEKITPDTAKLRKTKAFEGIEVFKNLPPSWAKLGKKK